MLLVNKSNTPQIIRICNDIIPMILYKGMIFDDSNCECYDTSAFEPFNYNLYKNAKHVGIVRDFAMGDLIQLIPVARYFKKYYNIEKVTIYTNSDYVNILRALSDDVSFMSTRALNETTKHDVVMCMNGLLEKDHSTKNKDKDLHRIYLYLKALGIEDNPIVPDWNHRIFKLSDRTELRRIPMFKNMIGLQIRGSGYMKTLPTEFIKQLAYEIAKKYKVVLIDQSADKGFEGENIINLCGKLNPYEVTVMLKQLKCCFTMDSGVLWLAHMVNCPVVTFLGPTRESERISLHPGYPKLAKYVDLAKHINCQPCFETKQYCGGKVSCMNSFSYENVKADAMQKLKEIMENQK